MKSPKQQTPKVRQPGKKTGSPPVLQTKTSNWWLPFLFILPVTFFLLSPCLKNGFTNWDDPTYILDNPLIKTLSAENLKKIFTEVYFSNYQPLHIFSYALEYHFFRDSATGYHAVSILLHLTNTLLAGWLAWLLTGRKWAVMLTGLLFGIHPLHVESIAWAAERKDLLYALFFFLSLGYYIRYLRNGEKITDIVYALIFFTLSVFSKAMAASLPPVLILLDIYYRRPWTMKVWLEKIPFFILALVMGMVSVNASRESGSIAGNESFSLFERILFANYNLYQYYLKLLVPAHLSAYYPYPEKSAGSLPWHYYLSPLFTAVLAGWCLWTFKKNRLYFMWTGFFVVTIMLVLQVLPVGPAIFSERYSYVPSFGLFLLMGTGFDVLVSRSSGKIKNLRPAVFALAGTWCLWLGAVTWQRCGVWKDSITLWNDVISQFDTALHAYNNRADAFYKSGQYEAAIRDLDKAISLNGNYAMAWYNRGNAYGQLGKFEEAFRDLDQAIGLDPKNANAYNKRGQANAVLGRKENAFVDFNKALELDPANAEIYYNIGITHLNAGNRDEACKALLKAAGMNFAAALKPYNDICR